MKPMLFYWVLGCVFVGIPYGQIISKCPGGAKGAVEVAALVAVWPAYLAAAVTMKSDGKDLECKQGVRP